MTALHERPPTQHAAPALVSNVPVLETERLTLRAPALQDFPVLRAIDESVADTAISGARTREDSWYDFAQMTATWIWRGHGWWTIEDASGPVGFVGIGFEPGDHEPELGYLLSETARGRGYATEAATAARDHGRSLALPTLVSYVSDANLASQNVVRKLGATRDNSSERHWHGQALQVWRHWGEGA